MCGIVGLVNFNNRPIPPETIRRLNDLMIHRGPNGGGLLAGGDSPGIALAMRRLSVIDLTATGEQPLYNEDKSVAVFMNGEIYNYRALRGELQARGHHFYSTSDTEVLPHLYEECRGDEISFLRRLNGMFAFSLYDRRKNILIVARDRAGIKPLYYSYDSKNPRRDFAFASELNVIIESGFSSKTIDPKSLQEYLALGYVTPPKTLLSDVFKLPPGHYIRIDLNLNPNRNKGIEIKTYYDYLLEIENTSPEIDKLPDAKAEFLSTLNAILKDQTISDVKGGIFLSGGLDSSIMTHLALRSQGNSYRDIFTLAFKQSSFDESTLAQKITRDYHEQGYKHHMIPFDEPSNSNGSSNIEEIAMAALDSIDDAIADTSVIPTYLLMKRASQDVVVALGGDGGDELFGGYPTYYLPPLAKTATHLVPPSALALFERMIRQHLPASGHYMSFDFKLKSFLNALSSPESIRHFKWKELFPLHLRMQLLRPLETTATTTIDTTNDHGRSYQFIEELYYKANKRIRNTKSLLMWQDFNTFLQEYVLIKVDRISMRHSLEVRVPYLDNRMIDFSLKLSPSLKVKNFTTKYFLRELASDLFGKSIAKAPKRGFIPPLAEWINKGFMNNLIQEYYFAALPALSLNTREAILKSHRNRECDYSRGIWAIITLNYLCKKYNLTL
ncbi:MAG: asparagine synthase (glutamine-hydrolyzing) [Oligoflexia bacterium]|nr:asparagine synthase (glutamine-hydrolyzing) [Oligoflexia bacterium]